MAGPGTATSLSVCCITRGPTRRVAAQLAPLRGIADEIVLAVDDRVDNTLLGPLAELADALVLYPYLDPVDRPVGWVHSLCTRDWILWLDDDEVPGSELLRGLPELLRSPAETHYWLPRRWLYGSSDMYLAERSVAARLPAPARPERPAAAVVPRRHAQADRGRRAPSLPRVADLPRRPAAEPPRGPPPEGAAVRDGRARTAAGRRADEPRAARARAARHARPPSAAAGGRRARRRRARRRAVARAGRAAGAPAGDARGGGRALARPRAHGGALPRRARARGRARDARAPRSARDPGPRAQPAAAHVWAWDELGASEIRASYRWWSAAGELVVADGLRTAFPRPVRPGEELVVPFCVAGAAAGRARGCSSSTSCTSTCAGSAAACASRST